VQEVSCTDTRTETREREESERGPM
jgi:hypothetical protein